MLIGLINWLRADWKRSVFGRDDWSEMEEAMGKMRAEQLRCRFDGDDERCDCTPHRTHKDCRPDRVEQKRSIEIDYSRPLFDLQAYHDPYGYGEQLRRQGLRNAVVEARDALLIEIAFGNKMGIQVTKSKALRDAIEAARAEGAYP